MRLILTAALALVAAGPASAAVYTATFTGSLYGAADFAGLFGAPGTDISGQAFTVVYRVDTGVPGIVDFNSGRTRFFYSGEYYYSGLPTAITATLTVNGHTQALTGNYKGQIVQENDYLPGIGRSGNGDQVFYVLDDYDHGWTYNSLSFSIGSFGDFVPTEDFSAPGHYSLAGTLQDNRFAFANGSNEAYGSLRATDLVVAGGIPEPATWTFLVAGFGVAGAALRRRTIVAAA